MNIGRELGELTRMTVKQLRVRYGEVFGEATNANNRVWLVKRIAWRIQAMVEGDLPERARQRAKELVNDADLRLSPPRAMGSEAPTGPIVTAQISVDHDRRLPLPGTILTRAYKGRSLQVKVLPTGFEYEGDVYKSLSAVAKAITGQHCNGFHFFRLNKEKD